MTSRTPTPDETPAGAAARILRGVLLLGRGDPRGIASFGSGPEALLSALAPSVALCLVTILSQALRGYDAIGVVKIFLLIVTLLSRLVVSQFMAVIWKRDDRWIRYATASLWCNWLPIVIMLFAVSLVQLLSPGAASGGSAVGGVVLGVELYELWLSWFVARAGLEIGGGKAALLIVAVNVSLMLLYGLAALLPPHYNVISELLAPMGKPH
ncbi:hypothetical protein [Swaminathania salitolerans]|uniref:Yip1 domain-containing protein n=1 Tax=Swaminathania salitolerans TaxID=182838 RepID=A0A511BMF5_9PROT|nr:hypothetical protein [Swaminathania salitolerans]GBQ15678.1 hypothetical protein AA21291_2256 [Swaminathania salitolerans LMG 21291]GEL01445.1 hypothetical protein SSA02_06080 [Swaminathania salitolerans]